MYNIAGGEIVKWLIKLVGIPLAIIVAELALWAFIVELSTYDNIISLLLTIASIVAGIWIFIRGGYYWAKI